VTTGNNLAPAVLADAIAALATLARSANVPTRRRASYVQSLAALESQRINDWQHERPTVTEVATVPEVVIPYTDRFLLPMLAERSALFEAYGMSRQMREVADQARVIREWQAKHLDALTPTPGVIPVRLDGST
jgi:hypothetical protein